MNTIKTERYVVSCVNEDEIETASWFNSLNDARKYAADIRGECDDPDEKHSVLVLKVLRV